MSITFTGFILSEEGYQIDRSITKAISRFPTPSNHTDLRSFFGLMNQLSASTDSVATLLAHSAPSLVQRVNFVWSADHYRAFSTAKESPTMAPTLSFFDASKPTCLCTDASRQGLGFILQQKANDNKWVLIQAGSRFLTDPESLYAVIELELLTVTWAITKCRMFLAGLPQFRVLTDHHSLIPILNSQPPS